MYKHIHTHIYTYSGKPVTSAHSKKFSHRFFLHKYACINHILIRVHIYFIHTWTHTYTHTHIYLCRWSSAYRISKEQALLPPTFIYIHGCTRHMNLNKYTKMYTQTHIHNYIHMMASLLHLHGANHFSHCAVYDIMNVALYVSLDIL